NVVQLTKASTTYPDRQFFAGGVDSVRGWLTDTFVPQENADKIAADYGKPDPDPSITDPAQRCEQKYTIACVALRGGNLLINPKLELRIPIKDPIETVLFGDAANLYLDPNYIFNH